jgi:glyoxylase-like metal-dependent hydrolase (beta-lactamase superfamily II)
VKDPQASGHLWSDAGCERVAPGVHRIPLPLPGDALAAVNVYAIEDGDRLCLVDAGWALDDAFTALEQGLAVIGRDFDAVDRVLVTHMHRDHYTMAVRLRQRFGTRIEIGLGERASLEAVVAGGKEGQLPYLCGWGATALRDELAKLYAAVPTPELYELPDGWIEGPCDIALKTRSLRALPTPGHTTGHLVFADVEAGLLFSGDHVLPHITPSIGLETVRTELPLQDFLESLELVRRLPDLVLLPAHGAPGMRLHARVDELLRHHEQRLAASQAAVVSGADTAYQAAKVLPWTRRGRRFSELDVFNQLLAVGETAAHLDVLVRQGVLASLQIEGARVYAASGGKA